MLTLLRAAQPKPPAPPAPRDELDVLLEGLTRLRADLAARGREVEPRLDGLSGPARLSARNLVHYVALRRFDLRPLQRLLTRCGLSSLGRSEPYVLATLDAVLDVLRRATGTAPARPDGDDAPAPTFHEGPRLRVARTDALLGPPPAGRRVRVMVTLPSEAAADYALVRSLVAGGMDVMRINCAHDGPAAWEAMVAHLRRAEAELGRSCRVLMDLPGPKVRTGPVQPGPQVVKVRPERDELGWVTRPARLWLTDAAEPAAPPGPASATLPLPAPFLAALTPGDRVGFRDTRGARRWLHVTDAEDGGTWAACGETAYLATGTRLVRHRRGGDDAGPRVASVGALPALERKIRLGRGDTLVLTADGLPGRPAERDENDRVREPARISCTLPQALAHVQPGEPVWFDEGRIGGVIAAVGDREVRVEITRARPGGEKLGAEKGINLPESRLDLPALTDDDLAALPFLVRHADLVGYSFVRTADDVRALGERLRDPGGAHLGIVVKVETPQSFRELPRILLEALRWPVAGVMIARGDLAVECGFERLVEVQEEILWLCEAAHLPVVWATQVLEQLTRDGVPSRAEVTDAAYAERAECVMLNKGPYVVEAVRTLDGILRRMERHHEKKRAILEHLSVADQFFASLKEPQKTAPTL